MLINAHVSGKTCDKRGEHKPRDNKFGATFCVFCGRVFNKPCGVELTDQDKIIIKVKP